MRDWPPDVEPRYSNAIFLDRDGTIVKDTHYPYRVDELEFLPGALDGLKRLSKLPIHLLIVTNQAGIALGKFSTSQMSAFNSALRQRVEATGGRVDAVYYCPHKEAKHLASDEVARDCSKPSPGMLIEAAADFSLDLSTSFMVGDKKSDIMAGEAAGCTTLLVKTGKAGRDSVSGRAQEPDFIVQDLLAAASRIEGLIKVRPDS